MALRRLLGKIGKSGLTGGNVFNTKKISSGVVPTYQNLLSGRSFGRCDYFVSSWATYDGIRSYSSHSYPRNAHSKLGVCPCPTIVFHLDNPEIIEAAEMSVKMYNTKEGAHLEFVRLLYAKGVVNAGHWLDLIVKAIDHDSGEENTYEVSFWQCGWDINESKLDFVRRVPHDELELYGDSASAYCTS